MNTDTIEKARRFAKRFRGWATGMENTVQDLIELPPSPSRIHDLHLLARAEELLEKDDRLTRTAAALKPQPEDTADYRGDVREEQT